MVCWLEKLSEQINAVQLLIGIVQLLSVGVAESDLCCVLAGFDQLFIQFDKSV